MSVWLSHCKPIVKVILLFHSSLIVYRFSGLHLYKNNRVVRCKNPLVSEKCPRLCLTNFAFHVDDRYHMQFNQSHFGFLWWLIDHRLPQSYLLHFLLNQCRKHHRCWILIVSSISVYIFQSLVVSKPQLDLLMKDRNLRQDLKSQTF